MTRHPSLNGSATEHEYGVHDGTTAYRFHIGCADSWRAELNRRGAP
jgi:hypothetical protein